nr:MAG: hypothetical protein 1 [Cripavirus sp.]
MSDVTLQLSMILPPLKLSLSASEASQIKLSGSTQLGSPIVVAPLTLSSGIARAENQFILADSLPVFNYSFYKKRVIALITEFNSYKGHGRVNKIFHIDSNLTYFILFYKYLVTQLKNDDDIKNCFFILLKCIAIARKSYAYDDKNFLPLSSASRLINASLCLIKNLSCLQDFVKLGPYTHIIRTFLKDKLINNTAFLSILLLPRKYDINQFRLASTANLKTLNAEFFNYSIFLKQYNNIPFIKNSFLDILFAYYTIFHKLTEDADISESGISDTMEFLDKHYLNQISAEAQIGINVSHSIDANLESAINRSLSVFSELTDAVSDKFQHAVDDYQRKISASLTIIYNLYRFSTHKLSLQDFIINIGGLIGAAGLATSLVTKLAVSIRSLFLTPIAQISFNDHNIVKALFLTSFCLFIKQLPGKNTIDEFVGRLDRFPKAISGLESMWTKLDVVVKQLYAFIEEKILGKENRFVSSEMLDEVTQWAEDVAKYAGYMERNEINRDLETMTAASKLYPRGVRLIKECTRLKLAPANLNLIRSLLPGAIKLSDAAFRSGANKHSLRVEPIVAWFTGATGLGKTGMTYPFIMDMMRVFQNPLPKDWQQNIHARIAENEYWDGYDDQEYLIYDDFLQKRDSEANPNVELFEMIRVTNAFPFQLHMSSVEDKSNKFCNAKFLFLSSNLDQIKTESLNCPEAVQRRIDYAYRVSIKPEFREEYINANGQKCFKLDARKARALARKLVGTRVCNNLDVYTFERFSVFDGKTIETNLSYNDIVKTCSQALADRFESHLDMTEFLDAYRAPVWETELQPSIENQSEADVSIVEFPLQAEAQLGITTTLAANSVRILDFLFVQHLIGKYFFNRTDSPLMALMRSIKSNMEYAMDWCGLIDRPRSIWETDNFTYYRNYATSVIGYLGNCRDRMASTLSDYFGQYWNFVKKAIIVGIILLCTCFKDCLINKITVIPTPTYISESEELSKLVKEANTCLENDCRDCRTCKNSVRTHLNVKWNSTCACYVRRMEKSNDALRNYCISMYGNQRVSPDHNLTTPDILEIVEQICNCDCSTCDCCNDEYLQEKLFDVATLHRTNCICLLTRLYQGFRTDDLLKYVKTIQSKIPSYIRNKEFARLLTQASPSSEGLRKGNTRVLSTRIMNHVSPSNVQGLKPKTLQSVTRVMNHSALELTPKFDEPTAKVLMQQADICMRDACIIEGCVLCRDAAVSISAQRNLPEQDVAAIGIVRDVVYKNLFKFIVRKKLDDVDQTVTYGQIFMLGGRLGLIPKHFLRSIEMDKQQKYEQYFYLQNTYGTITSEYPVDVILDADNHIEHDTRDLAIIQLPINAGCYPQAYKHIIEAQDLFRVGYNPAILARYNVATANDIKKGVLHYRETFFLSTVTPEENLIETNMRDEIILNRGAYLYHAVTIPGDCGSILVACNTGITRKIVGMHIAGLTGVTEGISVSLTQEMITKMMSHFSPSAQYGHAIVPYNVKEDILRDNGVFQLHGTKPGVRIQGGVKTNLARSPAFGALCVSPNKPGFLRPVTFDGLRIDPMKLQRSKYGKIRPYVNEDRVQTIYEAMRVFYHREYNNVPEWYKLPLTREEAVIGIDADPFINAVNRQTAPGYPYTFEKQGVPGKQLWFGNDADYDLTRPQCKKLMADVDQLLLSILGNERPEVIWIDTLKDAKIPIAKANIGKTRLFTACPMHYSIAFRQYFLPFIAHAMRNRIDNSLAVGINPTSVEWTKLAKRLQRKGSDVIAGDYSNFDGTLPVQYVEVAVKIMCDWLLANWENIVKAERNVICEQTLSKEVFGEFLYKLGMECFNHLHITNHDDVKGAALVYYVRNGIPSGCPATAILNSIVNHCVLADTWISIMDESPGYEQLANVSSFFENTSSIFYGDDFIMNIRHSVLDLYNQETITSILKRNLDMDMTDEAKTGDIVRSRELVDVSFLKRKFRFEETTQLWVSPMDINVILDAPNWVRLGNESPLSICVATLASYCIPELALHELETDLKYRSKMEQLGLRLTRGTGLTFVTDSRRATLAKFRNEELRLSEINY